MKISKPTIKALFLLLLCTAVFHWKILLTHDYSIASGYEGLCQSYGWLQFWILAIRNGTMPLWDPYGLAGHPFAGEMQSAAFYPLHLLLALVPFNRQGVFPMQWYHVWFALTHFLGGCFMFALARDLRLRRLPAVVAAVCFSLGGLVGRAGWPDMIHSAIWLPLIFLFLLRALRAETTKRAVLYACLSGVSLGMAILAGRLHIAIMEALIVAGAVVFATFDPQLRHKGAPGRTWIRAAIVLAVVAGVAFCAGAPQLFSSMEYGRYAIRFYGDVPPLPATERIPTSYPTHGMWPQSWIALPIAFASLQLGAGEVLPFYMGVFPLLAAVIGVWKRWGTPWVRYLAGLAVVAFLYALGEFSAVYGILRTVVPYLWTAREASRFMFMAEFALAVLAAYGVEALLAGSGNEPAWRPLTRVLTWIVGVGAALQAIPAVFQHPDINSWVALSILLIFGSYGVYRHILRGHTGTAVGLVMVALIVFDLTTLNWTADKRTDSDALHNLLSCRNVADFLKSRPGRFRVYIAGGDPPPIGDVYRVPTTTGGMRATLLANFMGLAARGRTDLLNSQYIMKPASASEPGDVYHDSKWKVYANPNSYPAAWTVHQAVVERSPARLLQRLESSELDFHRQALVDRPLESALEPRIEGVAENVKFGTCGANRIELTVRAQSRGLLVLSEIYFPGWIATVNGKDGRIYEVDGGLRGVVVPRGESQVVLRYSPRSFWFGAFLGLAAFLGTAVFLFWTWRESRSGGTDIAAAGPS